MCSWDYWFVATRQARIRQTVLPLLELESAVLAEQCRLLGVGLSGDDTIAPTAAEIAAAAASAGGVVADQIDIVRVRLRPGVERQKRTRSPCVLSSMCRWLSQSLLLARMA